MLNAIDLFCGAGGLSLGLKEAGFDVIAAVEFDPHAINTHAQNFPETEHINADISTVDFSRFSGKVSLVAGGPPCQPFSVVGHQKGSQDSRDMIPEFYRAVKEILPEAFVFENVPGLVTKKFQSYLETYLEKFRGLGYAVHYKILSAADYGVPQKRNRLFVVGVKPNYEFCFPSATHGPGLKAFVTSSEALENCPGDIPNNAKITYLKNPILRSSAYAGMLLNGRGRPIDRNGLSNTIVSSAGGNRTSIWDPDGVFEQYHAHLMAGGKPRHGDVPGVRRITANESARLQSFPDSFVFYGPQSRRYAQIGNAVPPLLARAVAMQLRSTLSQA